MRKEGGGSDGGRGRKSGALIRKREEEQSEKQEVHGHHDGMGGSGGVQTRRTDKLYTAFHTQATFPNIPSCSWVQ